MSSTATATIAYRVEMLPTKEQKLFLQKQRVARRRVWNLLLTRTQQRLATGEVFEKSQLNRELTVLKKTKRFSWLYDVPAPCTHSAAQDLEKTIIAATILKNAGMPNYRFKKPIDSFQVAWTSFSRSFKSVEFAKCPGIFVRLAKHDRFYGKLNHYHVLISDLCGLQFPDYFDQSV